MTKETFDANIIDDESNEANTNNLNSDDSFCLKDVDLSGKSFGDGLPENCFYTLQTITGISTTIPDIASINASFSAMKSGFDNLCTKTNISFENVDTELAIIVDTLNALIASVQNPIATTANINVSFNDLPDTIKLPLEPVF
jgi:hypothetical protein